MDYEKIYFESEREKYKYLYGDKVNIGKAGFVTKKESRQKILTNLEELIRNGHLKVKSIRLYEELKTFIYKGDKAQAMKGKNDDLVMSTAIGAWIASSNTKYYNKTSNDISNALLNGMSMNANKISNTNISPFYNSAEHVNLKPNMPIMLTGDLIKKMSGSLGTKRDFDWLF